ncbi:glycosyltransferase [Halapricum sp. CBA1109]|uniref:glycosyltransferase n=1 Tax=Halapricum sp. CBA1109 TaxID=2668068 RepID=UPI0012FC285C|nr:glycosyltransferase [Halapricum sp. CBA1109]MUV88592.1 glycosyltransferase [Halapricum sp. CBA1109]
MYTDTDVGWVYPAVGHSANDSDANYGHPAHRGFQERIDADPICFPDVPVGPLTHTLLKPAIEATRLDVPEYDIYVFENAESVYAATRIKRQYPDSTVILLAAHRVFGLESYDFASDQFPKSLVRRADRYSDQALIRRFVREHVDGVLAVSKHVERTVRSFAPETPTEVVHPYVQPAFAAELDGMTPSLESNHAITVCEGRDHKGVDMLVDAWEGVREYVPDATLSIVGRNHPEEYESVSGVTVSGYVENLAEEYSRASLYVHPARADAFGVTVLEAMRTGVVPMVTEATGSYPFVADVDDDLVVDPTTESIARGVVQYFQLPDDERQARSERSKAVTAPFVEDVKTREFESRFRSLLARLSTI